LWAGARVWLNDWTYRVQYRPRRQFSILDPATDARVTVWDVWGFFQGSFVGALEKYHVAVPGHMRVMKAARSQFKLKDRLSITNYCLDECMALETLMRTLHEHLTTAELPVRRWDGAGACAAALL